MKTLLIVFIKAAVAGKVKTRLAKSIGTDGAVWIYQKLLDNTASVSKNSKIATAVFENIQSQKNKEIFSHAVYFQLQQGKDLGEKMSSAFDWAFEKGYEKVILIGSDLWTLNERLLLEAENALDENEYVLGPSYDGGYYLIGMKRSSPHLFQEIAWSSQNVLKQTLKRVSSEAFYFLELANDIDEFKDLKAESELFTKYQKQFS
ncbi:MAG: TIGR04282 family arsenosugar biosynthesis glycosyltransferase [Flavobacteriaceae bacterium]|jgi:hypothetical protein